MVIKILGTGCPSCRRLEAITKQAVEELGITATFEKVTELDEILQYPIFATPGLVINERLVCASRIPQRGEIENWLQDAVKQH